RPDVGVVVGRHGDVEQEMNTGDDGAQPAAGGNRDDARNEGAEEKAEIEEPKGALPGSRPDIGRRHEQENEASGKVLHAKFEGAGEPEDGRGDESRRNRGGETPTPRPAAALREKMGRTCRSECR